MENQKEIVMNGAGVEELGFPMWPQFAPETAGDVAEIIPLRQGQLLDRLQGHGV